MDASWCMRRSKDLRSGAPDTQERAGLQTAPAQLRSLRDLGDHWQEVRANVCRRACR